MSIKAYVFDCETTPIIARTWGMWEVNIPPGNIIQDRSILCFGWKEVGGKKTHSVSVGPDKTERQVVAEFRAAIDDADILIGHNARLFDAKHLTAKLIEYDLPPLHKLHVVDTLAEVKRVSKFSSNRLDFLCGKLLGVRKLETEMDLWVQCMAGDEKALARMAKYCRHDVDITEALYLKLRPYMKNHPNVADAGSMGCPRCNHEVGTVRKVYRTKAGAERAHVYCGACSAPYTISAAKANRPLSAV